MTSLNNTAKQKEAPSLRQVTSNSQSREDTRIAIADQLAAASARMRGLLEDLPSPAADLFDHDPIPGPPDRFVAILTVSLFLLFSAYLVWLWAVYLS